MTTTTERVSLSRAVLAALDAESLSIAKPDAAQLMLPERAVQFGTGAFLRGFVDAFLDAANRRGAFNGRVVAIGSTGSGRDRAFDAQDGLYTLLLSGRHNGVDVSERRIIGSVSRAISATSQWDDVLAVARDPRITLVFSNTTEAGIALDDRDVHEAEVPHSFPAKLARFLVERARMFDFAPSAGVVVIPCELLEDNGPRLEALVREQAVRWSLDERFDRWLTEAVPFCNTLVDRIVPGTPNAVAHELLRNELGYHDALLTVAEPYALFAIEGDAALAARLGFVDPDGLIRVVPDVRPYRERKVRLLNGTHTAMAALGLLAGVVTVHEAMSDPALATLLQRLVRQDIASVLDVPDAEVFGEQVLERFANPTVRHRLTDIATQGTLKWRVRLLPILQRHAESRAHSLSGPSLPASLVLSLAAQLYLSHPDARAQREAAGVAAFADALGAQVQAHWVRHASDAELHTVVDEILGDVTLWGSDLRTIAGLSAALADTLHRLHHDGVQAVLAPAHQPS